MTLPHNTATRHLDTDPLHLSALVRDGTVRRITLSALGRRIRAAGADEEEIIAAVLLRLVEAQQTPGSRYDPARGYSPTTYLYMLARSIGANELRRLRFRRRAHAELVVDTRHVQQHASAQESEARAMARILSVLDTPEERAMARLMVAEVPVHEARAQLGLTRGQAAELRTRVRALLMTLREG